MREKEKEKAKKNKKLFFKILYNKLWIKLIK